jgi:hypothetical protein
MGSDDEKKLRDRIKVGEKILEDHEDARKAAMKRVERAVTFTGSDSEARLLAPDAFERVEIEEKKIGEVQKRLDELTSELQKLKAR